MNRNNVISSDEAHFEVLNRKNHVLVRRLKSEINESFNFVPRVQDGGGVVSVWRVHVWWCSWSINDL